jgi:hypothetical protein
MDNIFIRTDTAGNIKLDKEKSTEKIDRAIRCGSGPPLRACMTEEAYFSCNVNLRGASDETL